MNKDDLKNPLNRAFLGGCCVDSFPSREDSQPVMPKEDLSTGQGKTYATAPGNWAFTGHSFRQEPR